MNDCSLENESLRKLLGGVVRRRPGPNVGKAVVLWEETGVYRKSRGGTGPGTQGKIRRDNVGKVLLSAGATATGEDRLTSVKPRRQEGLGLRMSLE